MQCIHVQTILQEVQKKENQSESFSQSDFQTFMSTTKHNLNVYDNETPE